MVMVNYPADTVKTRLQAGTHCFRDMRSLTSNLYQGVRANLAGAVPGKGLFLCFYELGKENLHHRLPWMQLDKSENFRLRDTIATLLAAGIALTYETPFEVMKQNQQAHSQSAKENLKLLELRRKLSPDLRIATGR